MTDSTIATVQTKVDTLQYQVSSLAGIVTHLNFDGNTITFDTATTVSGPFVVSNGNSIICGSLTCQVGPGSGDINCHILNAAGLVMGASSTANFNDVVVNGNVVGNLRMSTGDLTVANGGGIICGSISVQTGPGSGDISCRVLNALGAVIGGTTTVTNFVVSGTITGGLYINTGDLTVANGGGITCGSVNAVKTPGTGVVACYDMNASHVITAAGAVIGGTAVLTNLTTSGSITSSGGITASNGTAVVCGSINVVIGPGSGDISCRLLNCAGVQNSGGMVVTGNISAAGGLTASGGSAVVCGSVNAVKTPGTGVVTCYDMNASHIITAAGTIITGTANFEAINASNGITASNGTAVLCGSITIITGPGSGDLTCRVVHCGGVSCSGTTTTAALSCSTFITNQSTPGMPGSAPSQFTAAGGAGTLTSVAIGWCAAVIAALNAINNRLHNLGIFT